MNRTNEIWRSYHELIASLEMRVTIEAKMVTRNGRSPHNYNDTQMIEVAGQPPYTLAMIRKSMKPEYVHQLCVIKERVVVGHTMLRRQNIW